MDSGANVHDSHMPTDAIRSIPKSNARETTTERSSSSGIKAGVRADVKHGRDPFRERTLLGYQRPGFLGRWTRIPFRHMKESPQPSTDLIFSTVPLTWTASQNTKRHKLFIPLDFSLALPVCSLVLCLFSYRHLCCILRLFPPHSTKSWGLACITNIWSSPYLPGKMLADKAVVFRAPGAAIPRAA